jgi:hypothetical protein
MNSREPEYYEEEPIIDIKEQKKGYKDECKSWMSSKHPYGIKELLKGPIDLETEI